MFLNVLKNREFFPGGTGKTGKKPGISFQKSGGHPVIAIYVLYFYTS